MFDTFEHLKLRFAHELVNEVEMAGFLLFCGFLFGGYAVVAGGSQFWPWIIALSIFGGVVALISKMIRSTAAQAALSLVMAFAAAILVLVLTAAHDRVAFATATAVMLGVFGCGAIVSDNVKLKRYGAICLAHGSWLVVAAYAAYCYQVGDMQTGVFAVIAAILVFIHAVMAARM